MDKPTIMEVAQAMGYCAELAVAAGYSTDCMTQALAKSMASAEAVKETAAFARGVARLRERLAKLPDPADTGWKPQGNVPGLDWLAILTEQEPS